MILVRDTDVPLQYIKWRNIIVHDAGRDGPGIVEGSHFLVAADPDGLVRATALWRQQRSGNHILVPGYSFNDNSIGVCLARDCRASAPTREEFAALVNLVRALQMTFQIPDDHVYLHSDLGTRDCPGRYFPVEPFRVRLIRSGR